ncbi:MULTISPECIES: hypothetical protein [Pseudomonas]|uniref:hypothetical protein n=1 Tax=Pseudomonas TaxID=286 RepID=UPI001E4C6862|nr:MULTISPECIES: hypothetical protein [Pseudomonas]MCD5985967.1 hypothetical protein [Pseudomonas sp. CDFA 610]MCQ9472956.1 hypothetical protein [Pseudomonas alliivorans]
MTPTIKQSLVEFIELVATGRQARWDHHNYCYLNFQMSVKNAVEILDSFQRLPVAFSSKQELLLWAEANNQGVETIGLPTDHAIITHGELDGTPALVGASFIWVLATSLRYREAIIFWLNKLRDDRDLRSVQKRASEVYERVAESLESGVIRKRMTSAQRAAQVKELKILSRRCRAASSTEEKARRYIRLLEALDTTLDADHVINKKSLTMMPDAWVMLAPVIASSNRSFGRVVEKYATKFTPRTGAIGLDATTAFKLFASTVPATYSLMPEHVERFTRQFVGKQAGLEHELQAVSKILNGFVSRTSKSFTR